MKYRVGKALGAEIVKAPTCKIEEGGVLVFRNFDKSLIKAFARHGWVTVEPYMESSDE